MQEISCKYEVRLRPVKSGKLFFRPRGKVEYIRYQDDSRRLKLNVHHVGIRDQQQLECTLGGKKMTDIVVTHGHGKMELSSSSGHVVPNIAIGDVIEICHRGKVLLSGTFSQVSV